MLASLVLVVVLALWLPGYAILAAAYPRGRLAALERHAMAAALGLALLPIAGLVASVTFGFTWLAVASVLASVTLVSGAVGYGRWALAQRSHGVPSVPAARSPPPRWHERATHGVLPSTRVTLGLTVGALVLAGAVWAWPGAPAATPAALWLEDGTGHALALPANVTADATIPVVVFVASGDAPLDGALVISWDGNVTTRVVHLDAHERASWALALDVGRAGGDRAFDARLTAGDVTRDAHFVLRVGGAS